MNRGFGYESMNPVRENDSLFHFIEFDWESSFICLVTVIRFRQEFGAVDINTLGFVSGSFEEQGTSGCGVIQV